MTRTEQIDAAYTNHAVKNDQAARHEGIRARGKALALHLVATCPESRELTLALNRLEEAVFYANAAIARNE